MIVVGYLLPSFVEGQRVFWLSVHILRRNHGDEVRRRASAVLGNLRPRLAVTSRVGRTGRKASSDLSGEQAGDRVFAGVVGAKMLRQEYPHINGWRIDPTLSKSLCISERGCDMFSRVERCEIEITLAVGLAADGRNSTTNFGLHAGSVFHQYQ